MCLSLKSSYGNLVFSIREFTGSYNLESYSLPEGLQCDIPAQSLKQLTQFLVRLRFPWEHMPILNSLILCNVFPAPRLWHHHRPVCLTQVIPDTFLSLHCDFLVRLFFSPLYCSDLPPSPPPLRVYGAWQTHSPQCALCSLSSHLIELFRSACVCECLLRTALKLADMFKGVFLFFDLIIYISEMWTCTCPSGLFHICTSINENKRIILCCNTVFNEMPWFCIILIGHFPYTSPLQER